MKRDRRGSWYLLTGAVLGIAIGLSYSWIISPVKYINAPPYALRADYKDDYRALVAAAYLYSNDLLRAEKRLEQLKDLETAQSLALQAQKALAEGRPQAEIKALSMLAMAFSRGVTPEAPRVTPKTPTTAATQATRNPGVGSILSTATPEATGLDNGTPQFDPGSTPVPTQVPPFLAKETSLLCNPDQLDPMIMVNIEDANNQGVPGIELVVKWDGGEDHFFTGLRTELGAGYADFTMTPNVVYSLETADGSFIAGDLTAAECISEDQSRYWGSWMLHLTQP